MHRCHLSEADLYRAVGKLQAGPRQVDMTAAFNIDQS